MTDVLLGLVLLFAAVLSLPAMLRFICPSAVTWATDHPAEAAAIARARRVLDREDP